MESRIINYSRDIGMTEEEFKSEIEDIYACVIDMALDEYGCSKVEQITTFKDHKIIINCERVYE